MSLLDTEKYIYRRQILSIDAFRTLAYNFNSRNNSIKIKLTAVNAYVTSVFLYNSELWTLTSKNKSMPLIFSKSGIWEISLTSISQRTLVDRQTDRDRDFTYEHVGPRTTSSLTFANSWQMFVKTILQIV